MLFEEVEGKSVCIICDTPYQVLVAITILYTTNILKGCNVDFYIGNQFSSAKEITVKLKNLELVRNAVSFQYFKGFFSKIISQIGKLAPKWALVKLSGYNLQFSYDYIFASLTSYFEMLVCCENPNSKLLFFEDGIGNYIFDFASKIPLRSIKLLKLFHKQVPSFVPSKIYLFWPELINNKCAVEKIGLIPFNDSAYMKMLFSIFEISESNQNEQQNYQLFFLQTPYENFKDKRSKLAIKRIDAQIIDVLEPYRNTCVVRPHPRQNEITNGKLAIDNKNKMWEVECAQKVEDNSILLSYFSTGQFTPKMLYGKEPWVFLMYRLVYKKDTSDTICMDKFINKVKKLYSDPDKIIVLNSINELQQKLKNIII